MFLQDFISGRGIKQPTVAMYIKRHESEFEGHTELRDGKTWLDDIAVELLSKKYPVLPVDDIWTPSAKKAYDELQEDLRDSGKLIKELARENKRLHKVEVEFKALETQQMLLIQTAVSDSEEKLKKEFEEDKAKLKADYDEKVAALQAQLNEKDKELQAEKNKGFFAKLFGK